MRLKVILVFIVIIVLAFYLGQLAKDNEFVREIIHKYGYIGVFCIAIVSGFNLAIPIPAISFLPLFLESGLNPWLIVLIIAIGVTIADMVSFFLGKAGRHMVGEHRIVNRLEKLQKKNPHLPILILFLFAAFAPMPNE